VRFLSRAQSASCTDSTSSLIPCSLNHANGEQLLLGIQISDRRHSDWDVNEKRASLIRSQTVLGKI
jgi:hypothetical protein